MAHRERKNRNKKTAKSKIVLIGVLVLILIGVIFSQVAGSLSSPVSSQSAAKTDRKSRLPRIRNKRDRSNPVKKTEVVHSNNSSNKRENKTSQSAGARIVEKPAKSWPTDSNTNFNHDPFQYPAEFKRLKVQKAEQLRAQKSAEELAAKRAQIEATRVQILATVNRLSEGGVEMTFIQDGRRLAKIEGKTYREGEMIDGLRIAQIKENGQVVLDVPAWPADVSAED